jgi:hypothetical protein
MYHKNNINILRRVDLEHEHVESMWFELKSKVSFTVVGRFIITFLFKSPMQIIWLFS